MIRQRTHLHRLSDERVIEYAEYGDRDGVPVFYLHGFLGSCHQGVLADASAKRLGLRIIAPNRPGIGLSTPHKFVTMTEYAKDVAELSDALAIDELIVVGASAGGSFALACGYALPHRVRLTGVASGIGPMNVIHNLQKMYWIRRWFLSGCHGYPRFIEVCMRALFSLCRRFPKAIFRFMVSSSSVIQKDLSNYEEVQQVLWWDYEDVFLQPNGIKGVMDEAAVYFHWGFEPRAFPARTHVLFWHGLEDTIVRWADFAETARPIPHAQVTVYQGGHMTVLNRLDEILTSLKHEWDDPLGVHAKEIVEERTRKNLGEILRSIIRIPHSL